MGVKLGIVQMLAIDLKRLNNKWLLQDFSVGILKRLELTPGDAEQKNQDK